MNATHTAYTTSGVRVEIHTSPKTAKQSQIRWQQMGFKTRLYWVSDTTTDTLCGLEVQV